jgi:hypothetical protein
MKRVISSTAEVSKQSGILIQKAKILKKIYQFYKCIQKEICNVHILTCHAVVLPAITDGTVILHHTHAITVEAK